MSGLQVRYDSQIPRSSLFLLLLAQFVLILPYMPLLPLWLSLCCLACGVWRIQIYRGQWAFASLWQRALLVLAALVGVFASYIQQLGVDAVIAFLLLIFFLKLLETRRARDVYVTLFLGYFIAATRLMHDSSLWALAYALLSYLLLSLALLALHRRGPGSIKQSLMYTVRLAVQGLPVLLLLFVLFPRLDPLWKATPPQGPVRAGISDSIELGLFGELAQSDLVAFRVTFDQRIPPSSTLYWRGLVFEEFDGRSWQVSSAAQEPLGPEVFALEDFSGGQQATGSGADGAIIRYRVILEPGHQRWLFALPLARVTGGGGAIVHTEARTVRLRDIPGGRYQYRASAHRGAVLQAQLPAAALHRNLALPALGNERARAYGRELRARYRKPERIAAVMMDQFRRDRYFYTLKPPVFASDSIDGFLLDSKRGYCEHYASAFVFVMRSTGVPARLVGGYLGGESNPFEDYLAVRQMDAHAWAEVWHQGRGWVRYDPTAMVVPERVLDGVEAVLTQRDEYHPGGLMGLARHPGLQWLQSARLWWDAVGFGWARWVLNYDRAAQQRLLQSWFGRGDLAFMLRLLAAALCAVLALATVWLLRGVGTRRYTGPQRAALWFSWLLGLLGSRRSPSESMLMYCARVAERYPVLAPTLAEFAACWSALSYAQLQYPWRRRLRLYAQLAHLARQVVVIRLRRSRQLLPAGSTRG